MSNKSEDQTLREIKQLEKIQEDLLESIKKNETELEVFVKRQMLCETP